MEYVFHKAIFELYFTKCVLSGPNLAQSRCYLGESQLTV